MSKKYFTHLEDDGCYTLAAIKDQMIENGVSELIATEAKRDIGSGYFFCTHFGECGEVGQSCGKQCEAYKPRNGKNGRCVHSGYCYEETDRTIKVKVKLPNQ